jgi:hypothetical protein
MRSSFKDLSHATDRFQLDQRVVERDASITDSGVGSEVSRILRERWGCPTHPRASLWRNGAPGWLERPISRSVDSRWPRALTQNPRAVSCGGFVSAIWSSRRGPRRSATSDSAAAPSVTPGSRSSTPVRPVRARLQYATSPVRQYSALFTARRAMFACVMITRSLDRRSSALPCW